MTIVNRRNAVVGYVTLKVGKKVRPQEGEAGRRQADAVAFRQQQQERQDGKKSA